MARFGPRTVLPLGIILLGLGAVLFAQATAPWFLFLAAVPMAIGWAAATGPSNAIAMSYWFDRQRPLALSLALNDASASGFVVAPLLVGLVQTLGLSWAVVLSVSGSGCCLRQSCCSASPRPHAGRARGRPRSKTRRGGVV